MLRKKGIIAGALALVLALGLSACGGNNPSSGTPTETPEDKTNSTATAAPADNGQTSAAEVDVNADPLTNSEIGFSKYETPVVFTYARNADPNTTFAPGQDYENNIWVTEYRDILGIDVQIAWEAEGLQAYDEKMNLMIASKELPDGMAVNMSQYAKLAQGGLIEEMSSYIDEYATDFYKENLYADDGLSIEQAKVDGKLYGIPKDSVRRGYYYTMFIREDWRTQLGIAEPKTLNDIVEMARAFMAADPDGAGMTYGIAISNKPYETWLSARGVFNAFDAYWDTWIEKNGKLEYGNVQPQVKTALAAMHSWYEEGLINPEFVTTDSWNMQYELISGKCGIAFAEGWLLGWPLPDGIKLGQEWRPYPIVFDDSATQKQYSAVAKLTGLFVIRKGYEHPEAIVKMANLFQERVMSMKYDTRIYKSDGQYTYEFLAVFVPNSGKDRNRRNAELVNQAIDTNDTSILENIDMQNLYRNVMGYLNGYTLNDINEETADDPDENIKGKFQDIDYLGNPLLNEDGTPAMIGGIDRFVRSYLAYWDNYGPLSSFGFGLEHEKNNMFMIDKFLGSPTDSMLKYEAQLKSDSEEMVVNIIAGIEDIDYFDEYVANWYANGGQAITDEVNEWYSIVK